MIIKLFNDVLEKRYENGNFTIYKNNKLIKESYQFPSTFNIGDRVEVDFGHGDILTDCYIRSIIFTNGKVRYSILKVFDIDNPFNEDGYLSGTSLHNIDSVFIQEPDDYKDNILDLMDFDNYS